MISDYMLSQIRGSDSAFKALCSIDKDGKAWSVPTLSRELRRPRQTVKNWVNFWLQKGLIERVPGASNWRVQYRRTGVAREEIGHLPVAKDAPPGQPPGYDPYRAAIARFGPELVAVLERRRDNSADPRFRLQALAVLHEFGCAAPGEAAPDQVAAQRALMKAQDERDQKARDIMHALYNTPIAELDEHIAFWRQKVLETYGQTEIDFPSPPKTTLQEYVDEQEQQRIER